MSYGQISTDDLISNGKKKNALVIDLRSDTVSKPSPSMRLAMFNAQVGDDVYGEDPTVKKLEEKSAKLLGKEAALFVTSGTMGNLISVLNHCDARGSEAYCGEESHVVLHEQGGAAQIGGVMICALPNNTDGTFDLKRLESKLRKDRLHEPVSKLVVVENTINGKVVPLAWTNELADLARERDLKLHLDGARLWNASVASGLPVRQIVERFDSVTFCLSKGLGAPVGSVLCGTAAFVDSARRIRKALGGGMRQAGILAAAGIVALDEVVPLLGDDHRRARQLASAVNQTNSSVFSVDLGATHTNMALVKVESETVTAEDFVSRLQEVRDECEDDEIVVRGLALTDRLARFVFYYEITDELTAAVWKVSSLTCSSSSSPSSSPSLSNVLSGISYNRIIGLLGSFIIKYFPSFCFIHISIIQRRIAQALSIFKLI